VRSLYRSSQWEYGYHYSIILMNFAQWKRDDKKNEENGKADHHCNVYELMTTISYLDFI
jgi:hypothetical protein